MSSKNPKQYLLIRDDPSLAYGKVDVSGWEPGERFIGFPTCEDLPKGEDRFLYYPWQGEAKIDHRYENGRLWVNDRIAGIDLRIVNLDELEDKTAVVTAKALPSHLKQLKSLSNLLALEVLKGKGALSALAGLTSLRRLNVWPPVTDNDLANIKGLKDLRELHLVGLKGTGEVSDAGLEHLSGMDKLKELFITAESTAITDEGIKSLRGLKGLETLSLPGKKITDSTLLHLRGFKNLKRLYLPHTGITDKGLVHLEDFPILTELSLSHTKVTDQGLEHLVGLKKLKYLNLRGTRVTENGIEALRGLNPDCMINC